MSEDANYRPPSMSKRLVLVAVVALSAIAAGLGIGFLFWQLDQTNADLQKTQTSLQEVKGDLQMTNERLSQQTMANAALTSDLEESVARVKTLRTDLQDVQASLDEAERSAADKLKENRTLREENKTLEADIDEARVQIENLDQRLERSQREVRSSQVATEALRSEIERLKSDAVIISSLNTELKAAKTELETLRADLARAQDEVEILKENGAPLILGRDSTFRRGFLCTGSMEPVITCLDEATYLADFDAANIVVGATIAFDGAACGGDGISIAHRVRGMKEIGGIYYFYPKGDASRVDDGCWVPHTDVHGYIIAIHRNVRPENAKLRNRVNAAEAASVDAEAAYHEVLERYCGSVNATTCPSEGYHLAKAAYRRYAAAWDHWVCWYSVAVESEYPGHIPREC